MAFPSNPTDLQMFGEYYYDLAVGAWRKNYSTFPISLEEPQDLVLDGTEIRKETIVCKNLTTTAKTTVKARSIWVWGDATISHEIIFSPVVIWYPEHGDITGPYLYIPGGSATLNGYGGQGCLGGKKAGNSGVSGGGGSAWHAGGSGRDGAGGAAGGDFPEYSFGGRGGDAGDAGGSGAGPGAGPGTPNPTSGSVDQSHGGELIFVIVRGTLTIESGGSLKSPGGGAKRLRFIDTYRSTGCGGGGVVIAVAMDGYLNEGTISADGASTGNYQASGGGGGHVEVYAPTSAFGNVVAAGGTGPNGNGGAGTTATQDTTGFAKKVLTDPDTLLHDGFWFRFLKGYFAY